LQISTPRLNRKEDISRRREGKSGRVNHLHSATGLKEAKLLRDKGTPHREKEGDQRAQKWKERLWATNVPNSLWGRPPGKDGEFTEKTNGKRLENKSPLTSRFSPSHV